MRIGIALGSNVGDRLAHLRAGRELLLCAHCGPGSARISPVYETDPVGCAEGTPPFLNAVIEIETNMTPYALRRDMAALESMRGRPEDRERNAPRQLDLDMLYAGGTLSQDPSLRLPHPQTRLRRFVLQPLADICPALLLPGESRTVLDLLAALPESPTVRLLHRDW